MKPADIIVVGGGCVGVSAAYHLAEAGAGSVLLLEREDALGTGSTGACAGGFRHQFSSPINVALSRASIPMITGFEETHGLPLDVHQDGYLFLIRDHAVWERHVAAAQIQRSLGVRVEVLDGEEAAELIPGLLVDDVVGATFGPEDGIADPSGLTNGYASAARRAGATIETGVEVRGVEVDGGRVRGVSTSAGSVETGTVINAAGPWAAALAETAGVPLPVEPFPRAIVATGPFPEAPERRTLVVDVATTFYFHREGPGVLMGVGPADEKPSFDTRVDADVVSEELGPTAVRVFPALETAGVAHAWAGLYEMTPDRHPIIGPAPGVDGLYLANGFSGHGFQHAPIVGKLLAEMIVDGEARTVDISALNLDRFDRGESIPETHVI